MSDHLSYPSTKGEVETGMEAAVGEEKREAAVEEAAVKVVGLVATQAVGQIALMELLRALM
jgi:hypothetical protein